MHSTLPLLLLLCSTKGAFSMHALVVCQLDRVVRSWRLVFFHPTRQNARATNCCCCRSIDACRLGNNIETLPLADYLRSLREN